MPASSSSSNPSSKATVKQRASTTSSVKTDVGTWIINYIKMNGLQVFLHVLEGSAKINENLEEQHEEKENMEDEKSETDMVMGLEALADRHLNSFPKLVAWLRRLAASLDSYYWLLEQNAPALSSQLFVESSSSLFVFGEKSLLIPGIVSFLEKVVDAIALVFLNCNLVHFFFFSFLIVLLGL
jgi:hypothetical protein